MYKRHTYRVGSFTHTIDVLAPGTDPSAHMEQTLKDCPDCQAALARGEQPTLGFGELPPMPRRSGLDRFRRPRWRELKRRASR